MNHLDEHLDDYVDDALDPATRAAFDAHLATCETCRGAVAATRRLVADARALPAEVRPRRDLWPGIAARIAPRRWGRWAAAGALLAAGAAIGIGLAWPRPPALEAIVAQRVAGDYPGASAALALRLAADRSPAVLEDAAYDALLRGHLAEADALLAAIPDPTPQVELRRALVASRAGDRAGVAAHGLASGLPAGALFAAEVALADGDWAAAGPRLEAAEDDADVGLVARSYQALVDGGPAERALARATAAWALGDRVGAVAQVAEIAAEVPGPMRDDRLLVWAGRAATARRPVEAGAILDAMGVPPPGLAWRVVATQALIDVVDGRTDAAVDALDALEDEAPSDGLADARATAAALAGSVEDARALLADVDGPAAARALVEVGDRRGAAARADGPMARWIEGP